MNVNFSGKVAVVTGAAQGIGFAIAEHLHSLGASVVLVDCNAARLQKSAKDLAAKNSGPVHSITADLAHPATIAALPGQLGAVAPHLDILVNNAGIESDTPFGQITAELFDRIIAVNLRAPLLVTQALVPMFHPAGGAIVNISSIHADHAFPNAIPYACSKAALVALTRNLALELAPRHIRANAVCPGYIDTPMWEEWLRAVSNPEAVARQTTELHPLGRRGMPFDVAAAVAYLAGAESSWITGTCLVVDGGLTVRAHS